MTQPLLYLHIGVPKTGTTAIQEFCHRNRRSLKNQGVLYPQLDAKSSAHHRLMSAVNTSDDALCRHLLSRLHRQVDQASNCDRVLLSSEYAARLRVPERLRDAFERYRTKVIVYLRRQDNWLMSAYNQNVKSSATRMEKSFGEFARRRHLHRRLDYEYLLGKWGEVFGQENVVPRIYEREKQRGALIDKFLAILDASDVGQSSHSRGRRSNPSLSSVSLEIVRICNGMHLDEDTRGRLIERLSEVSTSQKAFPLISVSQRRAILDRYRTSNQNVARRYFSESGELFDISDLDHPANGGDTRAIDVESVVQTLLAAFLPLRRNLSSRAA